MRDSTGPVVRIFPDRATLGTQAGADIAEEVRSRLAGQDAVTMIFAAAPSQATTLAALAAAPDIDWSRVHAFHMDEYLGLPASAPQRFGNWLRENFFDRVPLGSVHLLDPDADPAGCARDYAAALAASPVDIVVLGIGVNGHLAFNDPPVADFADPVAVKVVELDEVCRKQQVDDGCFESITDVPSHAITLTIPRLLAADRLFCVIPGASKAAAVRAAVQDPITTACPATALRTHPNCTLYVDADAAAEL